MTTPDPAGPPEPPTRAEITAAEEANTQAMQALVAQYGIRFDEGSVLRIRVEHLFDVLFGPVADDSPQRRLFDMSLAERYKHEIGLAAAQVRKQVLASAGAGLVVPAVPPRRRR